jgi:hypothetical protein
MTLVLGCLTPEFVVLTSDRRITRRDDAGRKLFHVDSDLKTFQIGTDYLVGYCGVARFNNQPMQEWVTHLLHEVDAGDKLRVLREAVEATVWSEGKHHEPVAFMGVGFCDDESGRRVPHGWIWSNALDETGAFAPEKLAFGFRLAEGTTSDNEVRVAPIGVKVWDEEMLTTLKAITRDGPPEPERTASLLAALSETVAARDSAVGTKPLTSTLAKTGGSISTGGHDDEGHIHPPSISDEGYSIWGVEIDPNATGFIGPGRDKLPPPGATTDH